MRHAPDCWCWSGCRGHRFQDALGHWWHSATFETLESNYAYALAASGGDEAFAQAILAVVR